MEIKEYILDQFIHPMFKDANVAFLDIETDGLSHRNKIIILGCVCFTRNNPKGKLVQIFNDDYQSEKEMLRYFFKILEKENIDFYLSFNGNAFDFPFINARMLHYNYRKTLNKALNIDFLKVIKCYPNLFVYHKYNLKSVEKHLGISRSDEISGKESIYLYREYIATQDVIIKEIILNHNFEDLINMIPLCAIFDIIPNGKTHYIFPSLFFSDELWYFTNYQIKGSRMLCEFNNHHTDRLLDFNGNVIGVNLEISKGTLSIYFDITEIKSNTGNQLLLMDSEAILNKKFSVLSQSDKEKMVIKENDYFYQNHLFELLKLIEENLDK